MPRILPQLNSLAIPIGDVQEHPLNAREGNVEAIMESLRTNGQFRAIVVNERNGYILAGNHTHRAAMALKWKKIAVTWVNADDAAERRILAADNATADGASYDEGKLLELLEPLGDLTGTGWTKDMLLDIYERQRDASPTKPAGDANNIPDPPKHAPITQPGDVWKLGPHKLICGDCTNHHDVDVLMGADPAHMMFTDPPYNVDYVGGNHADSPAKRKANGNLTIDNDVMEAADFIAFLEAAFTSTLRHLRKGGGFYVCTAHMTEPEVRIAMRQTPEMSFRQPLIWAKHSLVMSRSDYHWQHENILYGWREGAPHKWHGSRNKTTLLEDGPTLLSVQPVEDGFRLRIGNGANSVVLTVPSYQLDVATDGERSTIWRFDRPSRSPDHPTPKPVELIARAVRNSSKLREIVMDPFAGSGSTMIACELEGRIARMVELSPAYCDVICRRYQEYTGTLPERDGKQVSFTPRDEDEDE